LHFYSNGVNSGFTVLQINMNQIRAYELSVALAALVLTGCVTKTDSVQADSVTPAYFASADQSQNGQTDVGWTLQLPSDNP
jgi:PBP1b-binding outer membrane lipoprotein LpoB